MSTAISLAELSADGVTVSPQEAVAIVQSLIHGEQNPLATEPPFGPPTLQSVTIDGDGSVCSRGCASTPAVFELGILLHAMIDGASRVPGGVRYAMGRALLEVEAPPFDSLAEFSRALERFEHGERGAVIRALFARAQAARPAVAAAPPSIARPSESPWHTAALPVRVERRRAGASTTELRRQLRDVDRELFERRTEVAPASEAIGTLGRWRRAPIAAGLAAGFALVVFGEYLHQRHTPPSRTSATSIASHAESEPASRPPSTPDPSAAPDAPAAVVDGARSATEVAIAPRRAVHASHRTVTGGLPAEVAVPTPADAAVVESVDSEQRPVFSPAFASNGTAMFSGTDGSEPRSARLSLDHDLRVMTIVDDGSRNYHVQPSPDGGSIAFDSDRDGERGVYVANRDGTNVHRVSGSGYAAVPSWSPDASQLAFIRAEPDDSKVWNLWLLTLSSGGVRRLTSFKSGQTWSASWFPDGRRISYTHDDSLIVQNLADGATREYPSPVKAHPVRTPAVSPDGTKIVFQVFRSGAWLLDLKDGSVRCVLTDPTADEFAWAPDGRRVAFHSRRDGQWGIWMMSGRSSAGS
jgi:hypothetical protein